MRTCALQESTELTVISVEETDHTTSESLTYSLRCVWVLLSTPIEDRETGHMVKLPYPKTSGYYLY